MVVDANDREVIEACQRGDYDAFRLLFEAHKDRVYCPFTWLFANGSMRGDTSTQQSQPSGRRSRRYLARSHRE